ncbi:MAG TPA: hypothetical protein VK211_15560 [Kamptonema sp.]|nr:hypothetical protein [Kamptonema sp.]
MKLGAFFRHLGNPLIYYPQLAKVTGGVSASVLFCQVFHWQSELSNPYEWVRVSGEEIEKETGLNLCEQELARQQLGERSLLKENLVNSNILELWVDIDALEEKLDNLCTSQYSGTRVERVSDSKRLERVSDSKESPREVVTNYSNQNITVIKTDKFFGQPRQPLSIPVTRDYRFSGPWESAEQLEKFQRSLLEYFKQRGVNYPDRCVFHEIDNITKSIISPLWEDFISGKPLGESQKVKRDWEIEPGVPYPAFEEERTQYYVHKGEPLEQAVLKARSDLRNPVLGRDLWEGFLRKCDRIADDALKAKNQGVETPYLPPSFTDKPQITKETVMKKLEAIAPQFSLLTSTLENSPTGSLEPSKIAEKASEADIPSLASLQEACKTHIGKSMIEKLIAKNPEWGYEIVDGKVIESIPF